MYAEEKKSAKVHSNNKRNVRRIVIGRGPTQHKPLKESNYEIFLAKWQHVSASYGHGEGEFTLFSANMIVVFLRIGPQNCKNKLSASGSSNDSSPVHLLPSSSQEITLTKNRDSICRSTSRNIFSSIMPGNMLQSGNEIANCIERESLTLSGPHSCPSVSPVGLENASSSQIRYHTARQCIPQTSFRRSQVFSCPLDQQSHTGCSTPTQAVSPHSVIDIHGVWPPQELGGVQKLMFSVLSITNLHSPSFGAIDAEDPRDAWTSIYLRQPESLPLHSAKGSSSLVSIFSTKMLNVIQAKPVLFKRGLAGNCICYWLVQLHLCLSSNVSPSKSVLYRFMGMNYTEYRDSLSRESQDVSSLDSLEVNPILVALVMRDSLYEEYEMLKGHD
ncbi:hypothetical protein RJ641_026932 [Dillenia turbinata]|uniref:Uncharacterized protein n=1 Tax=Dillenia turbinata TaxID=194707 RepID=A0AAN8VWJ6_9MAGN